MINIINNEISLKNPIVLSSMSGITDAKYALEKAENLGMVILGSYNIDEESINVGYQLKKIGRSEFLFLNPIEEIINEIEYFNTNWKLKNKDLDRPIIGVSVRSKSIDKIIELAKLLYEKKVILEIDCHCRQQPYLDIGLGENIANNLEYLNTLIEEVKKTKVILSLKVRPISMDWKKFINFIKKTNVDIIHIDTMSLDTNNGDSNYIKTIRDNINNKVIIANNSIKTFEDVKRYLSSGSDLVSIARISQDKNNTDKIVSDFNLYWNENYGWYNSPNHICKNGDIRGLVFCCPPIKNCNLLSKLNELNISKEDYINMKLKYSKDTPLEQYTDTCFGSLIWCCKITKNCIYRDNALKKLNINKNEYMNFKKIIADNILKEINSR